MKQNNDSPIVFMGMILSAAILFFGFKIANKPNLLSPDVVPIFKAIFIIGAVLAFFLFLKETSFFKRIASKEKKEKTIQLVTEKSIPKKQEVKEDLNAIIREYLITGEKIVKKFHISGFFSKDNLFLTDRRLIKSSEGFFGVTIFQDIHYKYLNSISAKRVREPMLLFVSLFFLIMGASLDILLKSKKLSFIMGGLGNFDTVSNFLLLLFLVLVLAYIIGSKEILFTSNSTNLKVPIKISDSFSKLAKDVREIQNSYFKKK